MICYISTEPPRTWNGRYHKGHARCVRVAKNEEAAFRLAILQDSAKNLAKERGFSFEFAYNSLAKAKSAG